jgi:hypothetical protein
MLQKQKTRKNYKPSASRFALAASRSARIFFNRSRSALPSGVLPIEYKRSVQPHVDIFFSILQTTSTTTTKTTTTTTVINTYNHTFTCSFQIRRTFRRLGLGLALAPRHWRRRRLAGVDLGRRHRRLLRRSIRIEYCVISFVFV